jgi:uncharacterized protein YndB with AHSA1/START domain
MSERHELRLERVLDAPRGAVWRAWTGRQDEWFCPPPWRAEVIAQELRTGGRSLIAMHGPAGERHELLGVFLEIVPGERVVATDAFGPGWVPQGPFMVRIDEFADTGDGRTRYTAIARHWTAEAKAQHEAMGFHTGWGKSADQLEAVAKSLA